MSPGTAVPKPLVIEPSGSWSGDDGTWSTFNIGVGTPPQFFRLLPSTTGAEIWMPYPTGCDGILVNVTDCGMQRGVDDFHGVPSRGFQTNASSTWETIGIYELATEQNLWDTNGLYGFDTVSIMQSKTSNMVQLSSQIVAGVSAANVWLGSLGLGTASANFSVESESTPSLLDSLKNRDLVPSLSFGYTAGASYSHVPGSLILGGYDLERFTPSNLSLPTGGYKNQNLPIQVKSIIAENTADGALSLLPNGKAIDTIIDSTVSQLWLPQNVCDLFQKAFSLDYDQSKGLYLVNDTVHRKLEQLNPTITLTVGGPGSSSSTTDIVLPYAAFNLQAGIPLFNTTTNYFPIRVAANESQQVLGRALLQEAYVIVDWERQNFTIGQAIHQNKESRIIALMPPSSKNQPTLLTTGVIAGVAVGGFAVIASILGLALFFFLRARRKPRVTPRMISRPMELQGACTEVFEMDESDTKHELVCTQIAELRAESVERELDGNNGLTKAEWDIYELP